MNNLTDMDWQKEVEQIEKDMRDDYFSELGEINHLQENILDIANKALEEDTDISEENKNCIVKIISILETKVAYKYKKCNFIALCSDNKTYTCYYNYSYEPETRDDPEWIEESVEMELL